MRVAVFGKPGGGKSTLAQRIAREFDLPLFQVDLLRYEEDGAEVPSNEFATRFNEVLNQPTWVLDGFASPGTFENTINRATVLAYVERPTPVHYWWVTKRLLLSPFAKPIGWPENSPMRASTLASIRYLRLSNRFWTTELKDRLLSYRPAKRVHVVRSTRDERVLLKTLTSVTGNQ
jgi:adenylate kinase family enzyme